MNDFHYYISLLSQYQKYAITAASAWLFGYLRAYRHDILFKLHTFLFNKTHSMQVEDWFFAYERERLQNIIKETGATRAALIRFGNTGDYEIKILSEVSKKNETLLSGINTSDGKKHKKFIAEIFDETYMQIFNQDTQGNKAFFNLIKQYNVFTFVLSTIYVNRRAKYAISIIVCFDKGFETDKIEFINNAGSQMAKPAHLFR